MVAWLHQKLKSMFFRNIFFTLQVSSGQLQSKIFHKSLILAFPWGRSKVFLYLHFFQIIERSDQLELLPKYYVWRKMTFAKKYLNRWYSFDFYYLCQSNLTDSCLIDLARLDFLSRVSDVCIFSYIYCRDWPTK